jgi:hypothetical protein
MRRLLRPLRPVLLLAAVLGLTACGDGGRGDPASGEGASFVEEEQYHIRQEIAALANGKDPDDISAFLKYEAARDALIGRKQPAVDACIEALRSHNDWAVRLGCIEVLEALGRKEIVPHLIAVTADPESRVAWQANLTLAAMLKHDVIPPAGTAAKTGALPPLPALDPTLPPRQASEGRWRTWYVTNRQGLHDAWAAWWKTNGGLVKID